MSVIGDLERFFGEIIFPNLGFVLLAGAAAAGLLAFVAYRRRWDRPIRRHPRLALGVAAGMLAVVVPLGWVLASPLFIRTILEEPMAAAGAGDPGSGSTVVLEGTFAGADDFHFGSGTARILVADDGTAILRFESFSVLNGPDLRVYLSPDPTGYVPAAIEVGPLRATDGSFNYMLEGVELRDVRSVLIWCEPFGVLFDDGCARAPPPEAAEPPASTDSS